MSAGTDLTMRGLVSTRRQMMRAAAVGFAGLAVSRVEAQAVSNKGANGSLTALHQEIVFAASASRIYEALLSSKQFAAFSGVAAEIDPKAGGAFSLFEGQITGRNIETVANQRLVQAWRPGDWPAGVYSIVRFALKAKGSGTLLALDHTGFPAGEYDSLSSGWYEHYWEPLKKFLA